MNAVYIKKRLKMRGYPIDAVKTVGNSVIIKVKGRLPEKDRQAIYNFAKRYGESDNYYIE
jgi:hypothetical protein